MIMETLQTPGYQMKTLVTLNDALYFQLQGLYDADQRISNAIAEFIDSASSPELKEMLVRYRRNVGISQNKLTWVYEYLDKRVKSRTNRIIVDLVEEVFSIINHASTDAVLDATLLSYVHMMNHYKIAVYGTCRSFASELRLHNIYDIFNDLLTAEKKFDSEFELLATEELNVRAFEASYLSKN
jgi:ferritin-like metal-binding protein YciE